MYPGCRRAGGKQVTGRHRRDVPVGTVERQYLELCVVSCAMIELKSGDLCIEGSEQFQRLSGPIGELGSIAQHIDAYCRASRYCLDPAQFVQTLRTQLTEAIRTTDAVFPTNTALSIKTANPSCGRLEKQPEPEGFAVIDQLLSERMPECTIVDVLTDTEHWLNWTAAFGPLSGFESRLGVATRPLCDHHLLLRLLSGPTQTSRSLPG